MSARPRRGRQAGGDRDHHIAAVAHHFLAGDGAPVGRRPAPAVVVAAAETLPVTAFVAAGAARSAALGARTRWRLLEEDSAMWSAASHLPADDWVEQLGAGEFDRGRHGDQGLCWHLGGVTSAHLDAWAGAAGLPGCALPTFERPTHLFWCVADEAAGALAGLEPLARLAELLAPRRVDLILAPRTWPRRAPTVSAPPVPGHEVLDLLGERAAALVHSPVRVGVVAANMSGAAAAAVVTDLLRAPSRSPAT